MKRKTPAAIILALASVCAFSMGGTQNSILNGVSNPLLGRRAIEIRPNPLPQKVDNYEIPLNQRIDDETKIRDFTRCYSSKFGMVELAPNGIQKKEELFPVFDSWWNPSQPTVMESHYTERYETYTFPRYIDLPMEIYSTEGVLPGRKVEYTVTTETRRSDSSSVTETRGQSVFANYTFSHKLELGGGIDLGVLVLGSASQAQGTIQVGAEVHREVSIVRSCTYEYSELRQQKYVFDNSRGTQLRYFQLCHRQKFKIYFTTVYSYNYSVREWGSGGFGADKNWAYDFDGSLTSKGTKFFLLPVDIPYSCASEYIDNEQGEKVITNVSNPNIVYM